MSTETATAGRVGERVTAHWARFRTLAFGDRIGYTLFLGSLAFLVCYWRIGVFINDTNTLLNTLVAVERGHLSLETAHYGSLTDPGTHLVDGVVYGRNYGQVFLALPFLLALRWLTVAVYPSIAIVAAWSLLLLALSRSLGAVFGRPRVAAVGGSVLAAVTFAAGVATAYPLAPDRLPIVALQFSTVLATAYGAVLVYRLVSKRATRRVGVASGVAYAAVLPTGFWASIPKRHALTTALLFASLYLLYRAREADESAALVYRATAYVPVGLTAWVHAPEGFILLVSVGLADVITARSNTPRELGAIAVVLSLSLLPFFATNYLVTGSPIRPPRFTPPYEVAPSTTTTAVATAVGSGATAATGATSGGGLLPSTAELLDAVSFLEWFGGSLLAALSKPERIVDTFVSSEGFGSADRNMSVLESAPLLGFLVGAAFGLRRLSPREIPAALRDDRAGAAVDVAAVVYALLLVLLYLPLLPTHAQINVRYLLPLYPLALLALVEVGVVCTIVEDSWTTLLWTYAIGVFLGSQLFLAGVVLLGTTLEGAMRLESHVALGIAATLAAWTLAHSLGADSERWLRVGAVLVGLAAAAGTAFLLVSAWWYFPYGPFALPFVPRV